MLEQALVQLLLLLGLTVSVVLLFQRLQIPPSLGYLLVGVLLGTHTAGPVVSNDYLPMIAEFGIVFLLFSIGLNFSIAQIYALRHQILGLGTAQVALTTAVVALMLWWLGVPGAAAFVIGAVFAQSSTTVIVKQLSEQGEEQTRHGRLGTTLSVFQDITAVPFVVIIPVLGVAAAHEVAGALGMALVKAVLAFFVVFLVGRYLLRRFFHLVTQRRSAELFTLTVLFVSLVAAWVTKSLGLSMAFGAFLVGMMLGETEFRHQVEATIRPFRDVLLGLFFISIGMLFDPTLLPQIWKEALLGAIALLGIKLVLVTVIVSLAGVDRQTAFRTGMVLAVGGEFGFALLALGLEASMLPDLNAQIALTSVLLSMVLAPFLIRYNQPLAARLFAPGASQKAADLQNQDVEARAREADKHVVICGFGRIGQTVCRFLEQEQVAYIATDLDPDRVRTARLVGQPVHYGDSSDPAVLEALGVGRASLLVISHDDLTAALKTLKHARELNADITIMVRTRDETHVEELRQAGATEVIPETLEAGMMLVSHALLALKMPLYRVARCIEAQRHSRYQMLRELFPSQAENLITPDSDKVDHLQPVVLDVASPALGKTITELALDQDKLVLTALVRDGRRMLSPLPATRLEAGDVLVLFGSAEDLKQAQQSLSGVTLG